MFRYILGMSESAKEIRRDIVSRCSQLDEHLVKLMLFSTHPSIFHWQGEIYSFIHKIDRVKGNNKYPKYSFIREALSVHEDILDNIILLISDEYSKLQRSSTFTDQEIIENVIEYHDWLATKLSTDGQVLKSEVYSKLDNMLN